MNLPSVCSLKAAKKPFWPVFFSCLILFVFTGSLGADQILLRNGRMIHGRVISQTALTMRVKQESNKTITLFKNDIKQVIYKTATEEKKEEAVKKVRRRVRRKRRRTPTPKIPSANLKEAGQAPALSGALWRSALLPGWGQFYDGQYLLGGLSSVLFLSQALPAYHLRAQALTHKSTFFDVSALGLASANGIFQVSPAVGILSARFIARETYRSSIQQYNQSLNRVALVYVLQLALTGLLFEGAGEAREQEGEYSAGVFLIPTSADNFAQKFQIGEQAALPAERYELGFRWRF